MDGKSFLLAAVVSVAVLNGIKGKFLNSTDCPIEDGKQWFLCSNHRRCIPSVFKCDGRKHCPDGSDETACVQPATLLATIDTSTTDFPTNTDFSMTTDFPRTTDTLTTTDFPTITDTLPTTDFPTTTDFLLLFQKQQSARYSCGSDEFQCSNGNCIERQRYCDGARDCEDNSDERYCNRCPTYGRQWLHCGNRRCIPRAWHCDIQSDCSDGSDERIGECLESFLQKIRNSGLSSIYAVNSAKYNMVRRLKETREDLRSTAKWGPELPRIAVALFLTEPQFFAPGNASEEEVAYELSLQLMAKLALKKKITAQELALYINALVVSCIDPKDFFGVNLVAELRKRVNNGSSTNPFLYLTLCNAGDTMTPTDVTNVASAFEARRRPLWTDVQALATMAMKCINSQVDSVVEDAILMNMVEELKAKLPKKATVGNARITALVMQALIATNSYEADFDVYRAIRYLVRDTNYSTLSVQDMYYILPVLKLSSFVNISSNHCSTSIKTKVEILKSLQDSVEDRIPVRVSMFLGNGIDFARNWQLKVPTTYNLYQVLENIGTIDPPYRIHYIIGQDKKPYIVGIHEYFDDAENELFWFIYSQKLRNATKPTLVEKSPSDIQLKEDEELILWYRSGFWVQSP